MALITPFAGVCLAEPDPVSKSGGVCGGGMRMGIIHRGIGMDGYYCGPTTVLED